jgi:DnaK suppressor protein
MNSDGIIDRKIENINVPDPYDRASIEFNVNSELSVMNRERELINNVCEAIVRIDRGEFGQCKSCGKPIPKKRLLANPISDCCLQCKTKLEQREYIKKVIKL